VSECLLQKVTVLAVDPDQTGQRLDNFLVSRLKGLPKSRLYRIIRKGEVRVNGKRAKPDTRLQAGDQVRVPPIRLAEPSLPQTASPALLQALEAAILFEDEHLIIINKPAGIAVHGGTGVKTGLIEALRQGRSSDHFLELVHRLDKGTSGCLMIAKTGASLRQLGHDLKEGKMRKVYHALTHGHWPGGLNRVEASLLRHEEAGGERMVSVSEAGKPALTHFRVLGRHQQYTLMEARPVTGRTHQIRVHARLAGHPIVGDDKYGDPVLDRDARTLGIRRLCLHAAVLELIHPDTGHPLRIQADMADSMTNLLQKLGCLPPAGG
jgi:23S rRNA pseudouridine955/2504/2580 synthase